MYYHLLTSYAPFRYYIDLYDVGGHMWMAYLVHIGLYAKSYEDDMMAKFHIFKYIWNSRLNKNSNI